MRVGDVVWAKQKGYSVRASEALVCLPLLIDLGALPRWRCPGAASYSVLRSCATLRFSPLAPRPRPSPAPRRSKLMAVCETYGYSFSGRLRVAALRIPTLLLAGKHPRTK